MSKTWMVLCLPFADPEHRDLKQVAVFPSWRLIRRLLCFVRACLKGEKKKKEKGKNRAGESENSSRNQLSTGGRGGSLK